jgi:hypothetical protein
MRLSGPIRKFARVGGEGFFRAAKTRAPRISAWICKARATPAARKRTAEYAGEFAKRPTKASRNLLYRNALVRFRFLSISLTPHGASTPHVPKVC